MHPSPFMRNLTQQIINRGIYLYKRITGFGKIQRSRTNVIWCYYYSDEAFFYGGHEIVIGSNDYLKADTSSTLTNETLLKSLQPITHLKWLVHYDGEKEEEMKLTIPKEFHQLFKFLVISSYPASTTLGGYPLEWLTSPSSEPALWAAIIRGSKSLRFFSSLLRLKRLIVNMKWNQM